MQTKIYQPGTTDHVDMLHSLGLTEKVLEEIGKRALAGYTATTKHDAAGAPGQYAYLGMVRGSRDVLCPLGWLPYKKPGQNIEFVAFPAKNLLVFASSGDKNTGLEAEPRTKNPKGNQTKSLVSNNAQLAFPFMLDDEKKKSVQDNAPAWALLYHINPNEGLMRMELSLPIGFNPVNFCVDGWQHRIVLKPIEFSSKPTIPQQDFADNFEIEIRKKKNE